MASNSTEHFSIKKSTLGKADVLKLDGLMGLMAGEFLAFAVRPEGDENWTQSKGFKITDHALMRRPRNPRTRIRIK